MAAFSQLIRSLPEELVLEKQQGKEQQEISAITCDSREAGPGSIFVAVKGNTQDGHRFVGQAVARGCGHIVVQDVCKGASGVAVVRVADSHKALGLLAAAYNAFPARSMTMIGLTGTNGKTTVSWMIERMLSESGCRVGVIGTVNYRYPEQSGTIKVIPAPLTTPDPVFLQGLLRDMVDEGVSHVVMETSSHALVQRRLEGILFDVCVFTNLSRDHLDFHHGSMEEYYLAKKLLFSRYLKKDGRAVVVTDGGAQDSTWGKQLVEELIREGQSEILTCSLQQKDAIHAKDIQQDIHGFSCNLVLQDRAYGFRSNLTGRYNILNVLAAAGVGRALGLEGKDIVRGLQRLGQVPGRLERVQLKGTPENKQPAVFVDYAHTHDALQNVLLTLKDLVCGRIICIFGCGGDRDTGKRKLMGGVAAELADLSFVTSDNPRSEDPEAIIRQVVEGLKEINVAERSVAELFTCSSPKGFISMSNRKTAIRVGCSTAGPDDIVLIAGKGHEDYQLLGTQCIFFDDRIEAANGLLNWNSDHLLRATRGTITSGRQICLLNNISTDTRTIAKGDVFVALAGENFDGHNYVRQAVDAGAAAVIVHRDTVALPPQVVVIRVQDTLQALGDLAAYRRRLLGSELKVAAITGSSGKTTVKEMTAAIFSRHLRDVRTGVDPLLKTKGNFNNLIGLPLSLLPVESGQKMAILEMGMNHPGEIERLVEIADPDIGCITNIQAAHLEGLGSIEGVARAKGELFAGMRKDGVAVINCDNPYVRKLPRTAARSIGFAVTPAGRRLHPMVKATRIANLGEEGMRFTLHVDEFRKRITVPVPGEHNVSNCAAAAAIAHGAGIAPEVICAALTEFTNVDKRMQFMTLPGGLRVLNDCYNANPGSMTAALETVSRFGSDCRRVALLGDMLELGDATEEAHYSIGRRVAELGYDRLLVVGKFSSHVLRGARDAGMDQDVVHGFAATRDAAHWLYAAMIEARLEADDWLLVKGSRGMRMEEILQELEHRFATGIMEEQA